MPAERELRLDPVLQGDHAQLVEPPRRESRELFLVQIGQRGPVPEGECLLQQRRPPRRLDVARLGEQPLEPVRVDRFRLEREPVAGWLRDDEVAPERLPQRPDRVLQRALSRRGRPLTPQVGHQPVGRDNLSGPQREGSQKRPLLAPRQGHDPLAVPYLERPEEANLHEAVVTPLTRVFQVSAG